MKPISRILVSAVFAENTFHIGASDYTVEVDGHKYGDDESLSLTGFTFQPKVGVAFTL